MMFGATVLKLKDHFDEGHELSGVEINQLIVGNVIGFIVAIIAIKSFIGVVSKYGFKAFGWYRIIVGGIILAMLLSGHSLEILLWRSEGGRVGKEVGRTLLPGG